MDGVTFVSSPVAEGTALEVASRFGTTRLLEPNRSGSALVGTPRANVKGPASGDELAERIKRAILLNPYLPKRRVRVETHAGRVVLKGVVHSYFQKQMAQEVLRKIEGVEEISNELEVVS